MLAWLLLHTLMWTVSALAGQWMIDTDMYAQMRNMTLPCDVEIWDRMMFWSEKPRSHHLRTRRLLIYGDSWAQGMYYTLMFHYAPSLLDTYGSQYKMALDGSRCPFLKHSRRLNVDLTAKNCSDQFHQRFARYIYGVHVDKCGKPFVLHEDYPEWNVSIYFAYKRFMYGPGADAYVARYVAEQQIDTVVVDAGRWGETPAHAKLDFPDMPTSMEAQMQLLMRWLSELPVQRKIWFHQGYRHASSLSGGSTPVLYNRYEFLNSESVKNVEFAPIVDMYRSLPFHHLIPVGEPELFDQPTVFHFLGHGYNGPVKFAVARYLRDMLRLPHRQRVDVRHMKPFQ